ncbi:MAG: efflux RND transporter periplasmic adaptor subunit [Chloroflexaceae bacterium]|nr:efflux RND transporter periplasmic adaptor subunit [Chloroflexaceae bacterium]
MSRTITLLALSLILLLGACTRAEVAPAPTPAEPAPASTATSSPGIAPTAVSVAIPDPRPASVPQRPRATYTVQRGEVVSEVALLGRVTPLQQELSFFEGGIVKRVLVERGDQVEPGQLLAELELGDLEIQLRQARATYEQDKRALEQANEAANTAVRQATLDLEQARTALEEARRPARAEEVARARARVEQARADLATTRNNSAALKHENLRQMNLAVQNLEVARVRLSEAQIRYQREQTDQRRIELQNAEDAARLAESEVERARVAYETALNNEVAAVQRAEAEVVAAEADLAALLRLPDPFRVAEAERNVARAQANLEAARQRATGNPALAKVVATSLGEVERLEYAIERRRLYAPFAGEVGYVEIRPGTAVRAESLVISLFDLSRSEIVANLDPNSAPDRLSTDIVPGQPVTITFPRFPGTTFNGEVARLLGRDGGTTLTDPIAYAIVFDPQGMVVAAREPANVTVLLGRSENTLWLPPAAIRYNRERPFVIVKEGNDERRVEVSLGLVSRERVEILAGLRENDIVLGEAAN